MGEEISQKSSLKIILIIFLLSTILIIITTPIHEAVHWVISDIDPYSEPIEFHIFNYKALNKKENILSSVFAYVTIRETYPGSFKDRPFWLDIFQEIICILIQLAITIIVVIKSLKYLIKKRLLDKSKQKFVKKIYN